MNVALRPFQVANVVFIKKKVFRSLLDHVANPTSKKNMSAFDFDESSEEEEPVKRLKLFDFPEIKCPTHSAMEGMTTPEVKILYKYTSLASAWGYRAGPEHQHLRFEKASAAQDLVLIQKYSDVLFRSLWALENNAKIYLESDIVSKLETCTDLTSQSEIAQFVASFIKQNHDLVYDLAHSSLTPKNSPTFICIVAAARALMWIATREAKRAFEMFDNLADCFLSRA